LTSVLVVDDDPRILKMLCSFLKADGYEVATAEDGQTALDSLASAPPSLMLLDLNLPDIQGDAVFRQARATGYLGPIVLISADMRAEQVAQNLGVACLTKPFDPSDLFALIEQLTERLESRVS
jgi:DNA-binding response OmpR family regulator